MPLKVLVVAGARPNFMKVAPILRALKAHGNQAVLVHTGQHYDAAMSDAFFADLDLPTPDYHLGVGSGSHAVQTAHVMEAFEPVLLEVRPDWVVVVGDVNSTLAAALVAVKLKEQLGCRIAHVEAGLRSGDWRMPEEVNRVLTDRIADLLLTPSRDAHPNLAMEGIPAERVVFVGNVMIDTLLALRERARSLDYIGRLGLAAGSYAVATLHRPSNVDDPAALRAVLSGLDRIAGSLPVVFPIHPRTRKNAESLGLSEALGRLRVVEPLGYLEMLSLTGSAAVVLTDSGGLQEETTVLGVPCVTLREQTERPVTITDGTNRMAPWPLTADGVFGAFMEAREALVTGRRPEGWDGRAAERVVMALEGVAQRADEAQKADEAHRAHGGPAVIGTSSRGCAATEGSQTHANSAPVRRVPEAVSIELRSFGPAGLRMTPVIGKAPATQASPPSLSPPPGLD